MKRSPFLLSACSICLLISMAAELLAQPSVAEALKLKPMQSGVDYATPDDSDLANCRIAGEDVGGQTAWVVRGPSGEILRQFVDSNNDNKVDQWRYFRGGIEVYRDVDQDFNGKADQYRWLGTAGTRWGIDRDENGKIDGWKFISAEEVTGEIIEAIKQKDLRRFENVVLSEQELKELGLGERLLTLITERIKNARSQFAKAVKSQQQITPETEWIDFGGLRPGTIPAGTDGSTNDVTVYENVVAMVETAGQTSQVPIGTLVRVGEGWRVIDLPIGDGDDPASQFVFFEGSRQPGADTVGISEETEQLISQLEAIDKQLAVATEPQQMQLVTEKRADTLEKLAKSSRLTSDREMWWMQFADTVGTAAQSGTYPDGTRRLKALRQLLERTSRNKELLAHVTFSHMSAEYAEQLQQEDADFGKIQDTWLVQLESFLKKYPNSNDSPEAMLQLALAKEFAGEEKDANRWYSTIVSDFPDSPLARKAAGAKRRLECVGKSIALSGRTVAGKPFELAKLKGNVVLLHYWATWCEPCKRDMAILQSLQKKYARKNLKVVGVNVDAQSDELVQFFRKQKPEWTHLYEEGGLDSRLASEMGIFTLPVMLLIDKNGKVVDRQIHGAQLEQEIEKLVR